MFDELEPRESISVFARWRSHRAIGRQFGWFARQQVKGISDFAFEYYTAYLMAGMDHDESLRLALMSARIGDDITNYPELAFPADEDGLPDH